MQNWYEKSLALGIPAFPIRIVWNGAKYDKIPLVANWQNASRNAQYDWSNANGFGLLMGNGFYGLDIDNYKNATAPVHWLQAHRVTSDTRAHETISGGGHVFYRVHGDLPTRQGIVPGLDGRGKGGFLAFGEGYSVFRLGHNLVDGELAWLSAEACAAIQRGYSANKLALHPYTPLTPEQAQWVEQKLYRLRQGNRKLEARLRFDTDGLTDRSLSAVDNSIAFLLAMAGMKNDEICHILLNVHKGHCATKFPNQAHSVRAALRCAARALESVQKKKSPKPRVNKEQILQRMRQNRKGTSL